MVCYNYIRYVILFLVISIIMLFTADSSANYERFFDYIGIGNEASNVLTTCFKFVNGLISLATIKRLTSNCVNAAMTVMVAISLSGCMSPLPHNVSNNDSPQNLATAIASNNSRGNTIPPTAIPTGEAEIPWNQYQGIIVLERCPQYAIYIRLPAQRVIVNTKDGRKEVIRIEYIIKTPAGSQVSFFDRQPDEMDIPEILVLNNDDDNKCAVEVRRNNRGIILWRENPHP